MSSNNLETENAPVSILTEAKLHFNPNRRFVTVNKTTGQYVDEIWLKFLLQAEVIESYKLLRSGGETEVELTFAVEEY